jgi:fatty-acyl-CoA synthase
MMYTDGYATPRYSSEDLIVLGSYNNPSIAEQEVLYKHVAVAHCAVVAKPDEKWGEKPCAFIELKPAAAVSAEEIIGWCRASRAAYKCPRHVVFTEIPKTSTGKIQKFVLR